MKGVRVMLVKIDGANLVRWRKKRGYTQKTLSQAAELSQKTVAFYESGRIRSCKSETLEKIAKVLDIDVRSLILENDDDEEDSFFTEDRKPVPATLKDWLTDPVGYSMSDHVFGIFLLIATFRDHRFFYKCKKNLFKLIGDYFVNTEMATFTTKISGREEWWSEIIRILKNSGLDVPKDLIESFRLYRVKSNSERTKLLIYTYYYILEIYSDLRDEVMSTDKNTWPNTHDKCNQIQLVLYYICLLLDDNVEKTDNTVNVEFLKRINVELQKVDIDIMNDKIGQVAD